MYKIKNYTLEKAQQLGVLVKPSSNKNKKLDVYKNGKKVVSIGDIHFKDYPTYMQLNGQVYADERRRLYNIRHKKDKGTAGFYASKLLW